MSTMTDKMSKSSHAGGKEAHPAVPKQGDHFRCEKCGMEMEITNACNCKDPDHVRLHCCGQEMAKV